MVTRRQSPAKCCRTRRGVAAVEAAVVMPLIMILFLGAVDAGQFANCYQKVSDATREGARDAVRFGTSDVASVETAVLGCLGDMFPDVSAGTLSSATQVTVRDANGNTITGGNLGAVPTGSQVEVEVSFQFNTVRWISGLQILGGWNVQSSTRMQRE